MISLPKLLFSSALIGTTFFLGACGGKKAAPEIPPAAADGGTAATPEAIQPARAPVTLVKGDDVMRQMDFWLSITVPPADGREGPAVFESNGYSLTEREYEDGLREFLSGRERLPWLEEAYKQELAQQFQILHWLESSNAASDLSFRGAARRALRERLISLALDAKSPIAPITDEMIREVYQSRVGQYRLPAMVEVRIIQCATEEDANKVNARLKNGESFATLAATESKHESATRQGQIEPFARGAYSKDFEDAAFALPPGETSTVRTNAGIFIIQKIANIPAVSIPFDQVKDQIRMELEQQRHKAGMEQLTKKIGK